MKIITILLSIDDDGQPRTQAITSDGITAQEAAQACYQVADGFRRAAIKEELRAEMEREEAEQ